VSGWPSNAAAAGVEAIAAPRTYRVHPGWRWSFLVAGLGMAAFFGWLCVREDARGATVPLVAAVLLIGLFPGLCLALAWGLGRARVTVSPDAIEVVSWSRPRRLQRDQIRGVRVIAQQHGQYTIVLEPRARPAHHLDGVR